MKNSAKFILVMCTLAFFTGCGSKEEVQPVTEVIVLDDPMEEEVEEEEEVYEDIIPEGMYRSELTNELIDESLKDQRPLAVMVDNEITALPHYGVSEADIVYEMMNSTANERITRLMVLVKDWEQIEQLGSIRSTRPTNCILAAGWNAILCHDGGPFYINDYIGQDYLQNFNGVFSRVNNGKATEFTEYIVTGDLEKAFTNKSSVSNEYTDTYEAPHFQFVPEQTPIYFEDGVSASEVQLPFPHNSSTLTYNEESELYEYSEYGDPHLDPGNDNAQLAFKNLIIQECTFTQLDVNGYMVFNVIGEGSLGYYITNGNAIPIRWTKLSITAPTKYYHLETGEEITLNTGKTYIGLVPSDDWDDLVIVD
ncbi:MAG: DUF3048 domain-containing protein [Eubacteriales bacterium]